MQKNTFIGLFLSGVCLMLTNSLNAQKQEKAPQNFGNSVFYKQLKEKAQQNGGNVRCASYEYDQYLNSVNSRKETIEDFENWFAPKIREYKEKQKIKTVASTTADVVVIPVVVHVIHDNKPYGVDENIPDERVFSQITVLNQDFRKMIGTPGYSNHPAAADTEIEFCMAQRKPNGTPTNGINRVNMTTPTYSVNGQTIKTWDIPDLETDVKPTTIWDPGEYLNLWVVESIMANSVVGYAQFPTSSGLDGLEGGGGGGSDAITDGVVIDWNGFGSSNLVAGAFYVDNETGRTATHEIGHWLGLRHIWGDNYSCQVNAIDSFNDYCLDTPPADHENHGCFDSSGCSAPSMFRNYMDYSPNTCQNIFTQDQKTRMRTALDNSPRRVALTKSSGCVAPKNLDAKIDIVNLGGSCDVNFNPIIRLTNVGTTTDISTIDVSYGIQGQTLQTVQVDFMSIYGQALPTQFYADVTLPSSVQFPMTNSTFVANIVSVNGTSDENLLNNSKSQIKQIKAYANPSVTVYLTTDNYANETSWKLINNSNGGTTVAQGSGYANNKTYTLGPFVLTPGDCYTFSISDIHGDGICCDYGNGAYTVTSGSNVIVTGGVFGLSEATTFFIDSGAVVGVDEHDNALGDIRLYPNPASSILNVSIAQNTEIPETLHIYNTLGQLVSTQKIEGLFDVSIDVSSLTQGVYLVKINGQNSSKTLRFVKN